MKPRILPLLLAGLFAPGWVLADDTPAPWLSEGAGTVGGIGSNKSGRDPSKVEEYQDLSSGALSSVLARGRDDKTWFNFYGENFGRDDMFIALRGGQYERFSYSILTNWLPHTFADPALTPFQGSGTGLLTPVTPFPVANIATWNTVKLGYERKDTHGHFEWKTNTPWYTRVEGGQLSFSGTRPSSGALGTSPGNGFMDFAAPVEYKTNTATAEAGYTTPAMHFAANYTYSKFDNGQSQLQWINPFFGNNLDTTSLPADNTYQRITANGVFRFLPMGSTFAARYTWSKTTNDSPVAGTVLTAGSASGTGTFVPTMPNMDHFNGEMIHQTMSLMLTSSPYKTLDTRIYYNYNKLENNSSQVVFAAGTAVDCGGPCQGTLYDYRKSNFGLDGTWRLDKANRIQAGWDYLETSQNRFDYDHVRDNKLWIEWKTTALEDVTARFKYQYLERRSDFLLGNEGTSPTDPNYINRFIARFDNSDRNQNYFKFIGDWSPTALMDLSIEATLKNNDYPGTVLGRTRDRRHELFGTLSWGEMGSLRLTLMADYEWVKYDSYHRNISGSSDPGAFDPNSAPTANNYNWQANNKDDNWLVGLGVDWNATDKFLVRGSLQYFRSDGSSDVQSQNNYGNPLPIAAFDDWRQTAINLKGIYTLDKRWSFTLGYAYNKVDYHDIAYDGYQYTIPFPAVTNNPGQSYLNGYRAIPTTYVNTVYVLASMHF
jgi:MtrB/PioB family decaheme-associated outer membrane protein